MTLWSKGLIVFIPIFFCGTCFAETIQLKSGQVIHGKIVSQTSDAIKVDEGIDLPLTYFRDEITQIVPDGQSLNPNPTETQKLKSQADDLEDKSAQAIDDGDMGKGLDLMLQAIGLDPSAMRYMNYGSMLFGNGVEVFKDSDPPKGQAILRQAEAQLLQAVKMFNPNKDQVYLSQCYFLLGEMYNNAFADKVKAKEYYQKSADLNDYSGAKDALSKLSS